MKAKIFKAVLYTLLLLMSVEGMACAQGEPAQKEKDLELKMQALEHKMQLLQSKMDSLKTNQKKLAAIKKATAVNGLMMADMDFASPLDPLPPLPKLPKIPNMDESFSRAFKNFERNMDFNFSDKKLQEEIKSGDVKEVTKTYSKSYSVDKNDELSIDNKYGSVTVNTWNKNEFKVDVQIKAEANDQDEAQRILDGVTINDSKDGSTVSFQTQIRSSSNSWSVSSNGRTTIHKVEINYTVYMPSKNALTINNRYGGTTIPNFDGKLTINNSYGSLVAKILTNASNDINSRYGSTAIEGLKGSDLKVAYGSLSLGKSDNLNAEISYSSASIGSIKTAGNINIRYGGGLTIGELDKNLKALSVNSSYSSISLGLAKDQNLNFDVTVHYAGFNYDSHSTTVTDKTAADGGDRGWKTYKGHMGKGSTEKTISITSNYGSVNFN